jgi:hypothetical protein
MEYIIASVLIFMSGVCAIPLAHRLAGAMASHRTRARQKVVADLGKQGYEMVWRPKMDYWPEPGPTPSSSTSWLSRL